jgi:uncharacterized protein
MSEGNVEVVRALYQVMNQQDVRRYEELVHPDAEWISDPRLAMAPRRGREAILDFFMDQAEMFEDPRVEVERLSAAGERVLAFVRVTAHGRASGAGVDIRIGHVWTIREGLVVRGEGYGDRDEAVRAAGLSE